MPKVDDEHEPILLTLVARRVLEARVEHQRLVLFPIPPLGANLNPRLGGVRGHLEAKMCRQDEVSGIRVRRHPAVGDLPRKHDSSHRKRDVESLENLRSDWKVLGVLLPPDAHPLEPHSRPAFPHHLPLSTIADKAPRLLGVVAFQLLADGRRLLLQLLHPGKVAGLPPRLGRQVLDELLAGHVVLGQALWRWQLPLGREHELVHAAELLRLPHHAQVALHLSPEALLPTQALLAGHPQAGHARPAR
mmetsp:Transcript_11650/g.43431  ORF Transcript_11650/g.43431 Transcript_11650/m.43431 type:complete len:247 (+) Transcript_11650:209-949(+)